jgi:hypothetical protein
MIAVLMDYGRSAYNKRALYVIRNFGNSTLPLNCGWSVDEFVQKAPFLKGSDEVDPLVKTGFGVEIVKVFFFLGGCRRSLRAAALLRQNTRHWRRDVHRRRRLIGERLMRALMVVKPKIAVQLGARLRH